MRVVGIVCEYNPFHKGHAYQLREARRQCPDAAVVCVQSGDFVQRGEPALPGRRPLAAAERILLSSFRSRGHSPPQNDLPPAP